MYFLFVIWLVCERGLKIRYNKEDKQFSSRLLFCYSKYDDDSDNEALKEEEDAPKPLTYYEEQEKIRKE